MLKLSLLLFLLTGLTALNNKKQDLVVYQSENLIIKKLSAHTYLHISFLDTDDFGRVACNGMLVVNENKAIVFDTPTDNKGSIELIDFITGNLESEITAVIPTHFHGDCVGGLEAFEQQNIPLYATRHTVKLLKKNGQKFTQPVNKFGANITLDLGGEKVYARYFGEGHTKDNMVGYFPADEALFGGCLIKSEGAGKGYLGDANTRAWPETVRKVKIQYPEAETVIPGHGKPGGKELLDYTIKLFE
ncbi:MAG: subclass B1 metallo-beta-lactamase [Cyclobacteriaceae bacterium]